MAQNDSQVQGVLVEIFGESYRIGGDPRQVQQVAAYVDGKMKEIAAKSPRMPRAQLAMLAAMEVTSELFKVMSERKVFTERAQESIERLNRLVEDRAHLTGDREASIHDEAGDDDDAATLRRGAADTDRLADRLVGERSRVRVPTSTPVDG